MVYQFHLSYTTLVYNFYTLSNSNIILRIITVSDFRDPNEFLDENPTHYKNKVFPFNCPEESCAEAFKSKQGLNLHKLKKHNVGKLYKCDECEFKTPRRKDLHGQF